MAGEVFGKGLREIYEQAAKFMGHLGGYMPKGGSLRQLQEQGVDPLTGEGPYPISKLFVDLRAEHPNWRQDFIGPYPPNQEWPRSFTRDPYPYMPTDQRGNPSKMSVSDFLDHYENVVRPGVSRNLWFGGMREIPKNELRMEAVDKATTSSNNLPLSKAVQKKILDMLLNQVRP